MVGGDSAAPSRGLIRIGVFRAPPDNPAIQTELRGFAHLEWGQCRWVGRRLVDHPDGAEIAVLSMWSEDEQMEREVAAGQRGMSRELRGLVGGMSTEVYECRAYGAWPRARDACLLRIFRGALVEGSGDLFDERAAATYLSLFERNDSCAAIAAGIRLGGVVLATLWTNWDAVVSATGGDLRQVLPVSLPGWAVVGSAVHYELIAAECR